MWASEYSEEDIKNIYEKELYFAKKLFKFMESTDRNISFGGATPECYDPYSERCKK